MLKTFFQQWKRRPFPPNLYALRHCRFSYSQFGEDLFLSHLFGNGRSHGVYVDVGCFHPIMFSNTYIFYQRGWRGFCIDDNPDFFAEWARFRPADRFINAAIAAQPSSMVYLRNLRYPALNQLLPTESFDESKFVRGHHLAERVPAAPFGDVLRNAAVPREFDLLTIDCEGMDLAILQTLNPEEFSPRVICIEDHVVSADTSIQAFMRERDYVMRAMVGISKIFERV